MNTKDLLLKHFDKDIVDEVLNAKKYKRLFGITNSPVSKFNSIDIELCKRLYIKEKLPIYKIAMLHGVSDVTMRTYFINNGVNLKGHYVGRNSNNNYFETIDSPDKAYFLGLVLADGSIMDLGTETNDKKAFKISLTESDSYILETFIKYARFDTDLKLIHPEDDKPRMGFTIFSSKVFHDLKSHGVEQGKSNKQTRIPSALIDNEELLIHFIRGYFDGDGIVNGRGHVGFCGSGTLLNQLRDYFVNRYGFNRVSVTFNDNNNIYYVMWGGKRDRSKFLEIIYQNKQDLYLKRKYEKIKKLLGPLCGDA